MPSAVQLCIPATTGAFSCVSWRTSLAIAVHHVQVVGPVAVRVEGDQRAVERPGRIALARLRAPRQVEGIPRVRDRLGRSRYLPVRNVATRRLKPMIRVCCMIVSSFVSIEIVADPRLASHSGCAPGRRESPGRIVEHEHPVLPLALGRGAEFPVSPAGKRPRPGGRSRSGDRATKTGSGSPTACPGRRGTAGPTRHRSGRRSHPRPERLRSGRSPGRSRRRSGSGRVSGPASGRDSISAAQMLHLPGPGQEQGLAPGGARRGDRRPARRVELPDVVTPVRVPAGAGQARPSRRTCEPRRRRGSRSSG